jgi:3-methyladenine DNA glycosylase AlkD
LWNSGVHEARILASLVDDAALVDDEQFERWAADFASWDLCDQVCQNLFRYAPPAWRKAVEWTRRPELFVKRAGFSLMAGLAVAEKKTDDERFAALLEPLAAGADDDRPLVRKGASWALRAIGKRSPELLGPALVVAEELAQRPGRGARWVGRDAARELRARGARA